MEMTSLNFLRAQQLAYEYGRRGASLVLVDVREDNLEQVCSKAISLGSPEAISVVADVSKVDDCKRFVNQAVHHFGRCKLCLLSLCTLLRIGFV